MRLRSLDITELPDKDVLYLKRWQSNKFYPIDLAVRNRANNEWKVYFIKCSGRLSGAGTYTDASFLYLLQNNLCNVTDYEMTNSDKFNFE